MKRLRKRYPRYFLVQHDLASLKTLPNFIWNITKRTPRLDQVNEGDRWIAYAYIKDEVDYEPCSLITGFYECSKECRPGRVPLDEATLVKMGLKNEQRAWMIEGKEYGKQPTKRIAVPRKDVGLHPIESLLGKRIFKNQAIIPIKAADFECIRSFAFLASSGKQLKS